MTRGEHRKRIEIELNKQYPNATRAQVIKFRKLAAILS